MRQIFETIINRFDGGLSKDRRDGWVGSIKNGFTTNKFALTKHFDVFTFPKKLVPYYKTEADETKSYLINKFLYAPYLTAIAYRLYGLGLYTASASVSGAPYVHNSDLTATGWEDPVTGYTAGEKAVNYSVFFYYKNYIYWWQGGNQLARFGVLTGATTVAEYKAITYTNLAQPVHHPADDCAYFFQDNVVHKLNDTSWSASVLTLPAQFKIVAACPFGNYLAIACVSLQDLDKESVVYLWDRDSSLATLTERIDFGKGEIRHLANLNNKLTAVMNYYVDNAIGLNRGKILIKQASGNFAVTLNEIITDAYVTPGLVLPAVRMITNDKLYFVTRATLNSDNREGIWVVDEYGRVALDTVEEDLATGTAFQGIFRLGNQWWIAHSEDGSIQRTDDAAAYSTTLASVYESLIFNAGDSDLNKKLIGAAVMTEKMPTAGQIVLKYRINGATSWTTIYTDTTNSQISHGAINIEADGTNLPEYKEIEFQILSTGGACITGLKFKSELVPRQLF